MTDPSPARREPDGPSEAPELDEHDDDALSWGDERDTSHVEGPTPVEHGDAEADDQLPGGMSSASLVGHGVFGGVALLSCVGWLVSRDQFLTSFGGTAVDRVQTALWLLGVALAIVAPAVWFVTTMLLVPQSRSSRRLLVFAVGAVALAPWPLVIGGGA
ncbi:hypothetical protein [Frigoribacterium sp. PvP032]|uniref:hypothetical protein n=1 Tax=Frigoribacterium sp. PvP032 TaxID=2806589 RepID=UPI001AE4D8BE|nr:hypothetical protein [Frigoribacterium sp. PvP032]MBP1190334.1 hypothetical protein [Frigoribacterium sp. PvP032]